MISIEDLNLIFYISVLIQPNNKSHHEMKRKPNLNNALLLLLGLWPQKMMVSVYWNTFLVHFTMLAPKSIIPQIAFFTRNDKECWVNHLVLVTLYRGSQSSIEQDN